MIQYNLKYHYFLSYITKSNYVDFRKIKDIMFCFRVFPVQPEAKNKRSNKHSVFYHLEYSKVTKSKTSIYNSYLFIKLNSLS